MAVLAKLTIQLQNYQQDFRPDFTPKSNRNALKDAEKDPENEKKLESVEKGGDTFLGFIQNKASDVALAKVEQGLAEPLKEKITIEARKSALKLTSALTASDVSFGDIKSPQVFEGITQTIQKNFNKENLLNDQEPTEKAVDLKVQETESHHLLGSNPIKSKSKDALGHEAKPVTTVLTTIEETSESPISNTSDLKFHSKVADIKLPKQSDDLKLLKPALESIELKSNSEDQKNSSELNTQILSEPKIEEAKQEEIHKKSVESVRKEHEIVNDAPKMSSNDQKVLEFSPKEALEITKDNDLKVEGGIIEVKAPETNETVVIILPQQSEIEKVNLESVQQAESTMKNPSTNQEKIDEGKDEEMNETKPISTDILTTDFTEDSNPIQEEGGKSKKKKRNKK